jgi:hypothetical protein
LAALVSGIEAGSSLAVTTIGVGDSPKPVTGLA